MRLDRVPHLLHVHDLAAVIYPVPVHWIWSKTAWLADLGFSDFAEYAASWARTSSGLDGTLQQGERQATNSSLECRAALSREDNIIAVVDI